MQNWFLDKKIVYSLMCIMLFPQSGVGVEFIRPETGLINQTPTLIQRQVGLFPVFTETGYVKTGIYLFLFSGTFGHDASCPYIGLLASIFFARYEMLDTRYEFSFVLFVLSF